MRLFVSLTVVALLATQHRALLRVERPKDPFSKRLVIEHLQGL
jgi:hypothetical protein